MLTRFFFLKYRLCLNYTGNCHFYSPVSYMIVCLSLYSLDVSWLGFLSFITIIFLTLNSYHYLYLSFVPEHLSNHTLLSKWSSMCSNIMCASLTYYVIVYHIVLEFVLVPVPTSWLQFLSLSLILCFKHQVLSFFFTPYFFLRYCSKFEYCFLQTKNICERALENACLSNVYACLSTFIDF